MKMGPGVPSDGHPKYPAKVGEHIGLQIRGSDRGQLSGINWNIDIEKS